MENKELAQWVVARIQPIAKARTRSMMGGYLLYADDHLIGQINEGSVFFKSTQEEEEYAPNLVRASPYPGAKVAIVIPINRIEDEQWFDGMVGATITGLSL